MKNNPTIILRMTNSCNLNCSYCYDKNNHINPQKENIKFLNNMNTLVDNIKKILVNKNCRDKIIFHGGEPLLIDAKNYENLILKLIQFNPYIRFSIQTNGTLLTKEHINVFKKYNVSIGISLDGYNEEMNKYRIYSNGKNSFKIIMKKIEILKNEKVKFGLIMSLSKEILGHEQELYDFIAQNNIKCNIRPIFMNENRK